jgi:hypothetical protein
MGRTVDDVAKNGSRTQHSDQAGNVYSCNATTTGESSWNMPSGLVRFRLRERMGNQLGGGGAESIPTAQASAAQALFAPGSNKNIPLSMGAVQAIICHRQANQAVQFKSIEHPQSR